MILIIDNDDYWINQYIAYLQSKNIDYLTLNLREIIYKTTIYDKLTNKEMSCSWLCEQKNFDFSEITGIYHRFYSLENLFDGYEQTDKQYVMQEWLAYIIYRLAQHVNTINPIKPEFTSVCGLNFLSMFKLASQCGFKVPNYYASTDRQKLKNFATTNGYILRKDLYDYTKFSLDEDEGICAVEYKYGSPVFIYIIGDCIVSSTIYYKEGKERIDLPDEIKQKCLAIARKLQVTIIELYLHKTLDNNYCFYYWSLFPDWSHCSHEIDIWDRITMLLKTKKSNRLSHQTVQLKPAGLASKINAFIELKYRPHVLASYIPDIGNEVQLSNQLEAPLSPFLREPERQPPLVSSQ